MVCKCFVDSAEDASTFAANAATDKDHSCAVGGKPCPAHPVAEPLAWDLCQLVPPSADIGKVKELYSLGVEPDSHYPLVTPNDPANEWSLLYRWAKVQQGVCQWVVARGVICPQSFPVSLADVRPRDITDDLTNGGLIDVIGVA